VVRVQRAMDRVECRPGAGSAPGPRRAGGAPYCRMRTGDVGAPRRGGTAGRGVGVRRPPQPSRHVPQLDDQPRRPPRPHGSGEAAGLAVRGGGRRSGDRAALAGWPLRHARPESGRVVRLYLPIARQRPRACDRRHARVDPVAGRPRRPRSGAAGRDPVRRGRRLPRGPHRAGAGGLAARDPLDPAHALPDQRARRHPDRTATPRRAHAVRQGRDP
jgi:hypothetical protein